MRMAEGQEASKQPHRFRWEAVKLRDSFRPGPQPQPGSVEAAGANERRNG